jgi:hypothetical protein
VQGDDTFGPTSKDKLFLPAVPSATVHDLQTLLLAPADPAKPDPETAARKPSRRRSPYSSIIGRRAEEIVLAHLKATLGWDIEYHLPAGDLVAVEVKGTGAALFTSFELTAGEWRAARDMRTRYRLALVAACTSNAPRIGWLEDPATHVEDGDFLCTPLAIDSLTQPSWPRVRPPLR